MIIEPEIKLDFKDVLIRPKRSTLTTRKEVDLSRKFSFVNAKLDIPYYVLDYTESFSDKVVDNFIDMYAQGLTPNPCVECNRSVKFDHFLKQAKKWNMNKIKKIMNKTYNLELEIKSNSIVNKNILLKKLLIDICNLANAS